MVLERGSIAQPAAGVRAGLATLFLAAAMAGGSLVGAGPAAAHAMLTGSSPEDGETVTEPPTEIVLEFNEPARGEFTQVAVLDAAENHYETGDARVDGNGVTQAVGDLPAGEYQVSYRVNSGDGHPVNGTIEFTVAGSATPSPETATPSPAAATPSPETAGPSLEAVEDDTQETAASGEENSAPLWLALAGAALVATAAALIIARRRPGGGPGGSGTDTGR